MSEQAYQATAPEKLRSFLFDSMRPKSEHEHWAVRHIEKLERDLADLRKLISKSSLIEVDATIVTNEGGHPVIINDGTMLVHKDYIVRENEKTKLFQKMAGMAREIGELKDTKR